MLNQIFNEDCLEGMKRIPDWSIDCIITDPPYWTTACKWDTVIPFDLMWEQLKRIIKPNGAIVLFGSEPFSSALRMSNIKNYRYDWIWEKTHWTQFSLCKKRPLKYHEDMIVFYTTQPTYNPQMIKWKPNHSMWKVVWTDLHSETQAHMVAFQSQQSDMKYPKTVLKFSNPRFKGQHPTQKPVALIEYLIRTYTNEWETVLDFTIGSWTTAIACINTNRNYIGFELDKWYFDIANERIAWKLQNKE